MSLSPVLLLGGSGMAGRQSARYFRAAHPEVPLLIGGRNLAKAEEVADEIGNAQGIAVDLAVENLGLGQRPVSAVALFPKDDSLAGLRSAQAQDVPYLSISGGLTEIGPEVAAYIHAPQAAPVVLGAEWLVGATSVPTLEFAKAFGRIDDLTIGALIDEEDKGGPATAVDFERLTKTMPAALTRRDGSYAWRDGEDATATFVAVDGTAMEALAFSPFDILGLATATGAPNVQFHLVEGVSSTRRRGEPASTEIIIQLTGEDHKGQPLRTRHGVVHPEGAMALTGFGVAMILERLLGLDGNPATPPGLYFPYQLLDSAAYLAGLEKIGGTVMALPSL